MENVRKCLDLNLAGEQCILEEGHLGNHVGVAGNSWPVALCCYQDSQGHFCERKLNHSGEHCFPSSNSVAYSPDLKPTNAKDRAATSRLDISLFPSTAIAYGALGMTEGDCKYAGYNYRAAGVLASIYVAALMRHTMKWIEGEECDQKTLVPHLASMIACVAILIDAKECGKLKDDRPPKLCNMPGLLDRFQSIVKHLQKLYPNGPERYTEVGMRAMQQKSQI